MSAKFIVVGAPRTGSTLLIKTLSSLTGICCHGELLLPTVVRGYEDGFVPEEASKQKRDDRASRLLEIRENDPVRFIQGALSSSNAATGCKILYKEFLLPHWSNVTQSLLALPDIKVIHLVRHNSLRRYISMQSLMGGGAIHSNPGGRGDKRVKVHVDIDDFLRTCAEIEAQTQTMSSLLSQHSVLYVSYEVLSSDVRTTVSNICYFLELDIDAVNIVPALDKVGSQDLRDAVSNYQELLDHSATRAMVLSD
jgi:LPS sulfotransferase NodH